MSSRAVKTEAVVLRSMRYGEADRILHLYTPDRGRVSAIAKGVRRARSRFGGRLEPFFRLHIELHEGGGALLTGSGANTADARERPSPGSRAAALAFRLKLLLAAGLAPHLGACASCGEREHLVGFSGAAGGVVCTACEAGSFALGQDAYVFMTEALGRALTEVPQAQAPALGQVERAIAATLEHHAHVRLMPSVGHAGWPSERKG